MEKALTDFPLDIKVMTRDNPVTLSLVLRSLHADISKDDDLVPSVTLIDDSTRQENQKINRNLLRDIIEDDRSNANYFGKSDWSKTIAIAPKEIRRMLTSQIGMLGSEKYQPSRPKNVSQFVGGSSKYTLIVDDDILINPMNESECSIVKTCLIKARKTSSFVSVDLLGIPDVSFIQLLERSLINDVSNLHSWNTDTSSYTLSGGFLLYSIDEFIPSFPKCYNEDFIWVAYCAIKCNAGTQKLHLGVYHSPTKTKSLSSDRLSFEAFGEILFETLVITNLRDFVEKGIIPTRTEIEKTRNEYFDYVDYVSTLVKEFKKDELLKSSVLGQLDFNWCREKLAEHLGHIASISYEEIQNFLKEWVEQQEKWNNARVGFMNSLN